MSMQIFQEPVHTYKTWENAKKKIDSLEDGNYRWIIASTKEGRFFPVIMFSHDEINRDRTDGSYLDHHYFITNKCCVKVD